jgi:hypothetical protein
MKPELETKGSGPYLGARRVLLRLASEAQIPGTLIISIGSCPWPEPWFRTHGAHLVIQVRGDLNASTVSAAPPPSPSPSPSPD